MKTFFHKLKLYFKEFLKYSFSFAFFISLFNYPLYTFLGMIGIILLIGIVVGFSTLMVKSFIEKDFSMLDKESLSNNQIAKKAFGWNVLSRLILLKLLNDIDKKEEEKHTNTTHTPLNCWDVLEINYAGTLADVKKAYKRLAKIYHPDTTKLEPLNAKQKFDELTRCKNSLIKKTKGK